MEYSSQLHKPIPPRTSKKRPRASRRPPTTVLATDISNFRAMVQEFTGAPSPPPFSPSSFHHHHHHHLLLRPFPPKLITTSPSNSPPLLLQPPPPPTTTFSSSWVSHPQGNELLGLVAGGAGGSKPTQLGQIAASCKMVNYSAGVGL